MAQVTIRLRYNRKTGKKDLLIDHHSDEDALPVEHEQEHRDIVHALLGQGLLTEDELGSIVVQRVQPASAPPLTEHTPSPEHLSEGQG